MQTPTAPTVGIETQSTDPLEQIAGPGFVRALVKRRAKRLCRVFGLPATDVEEMEAELWLEICRSFQRFDPSRGSPQAFADGVASVWYCERARSLRRELRPLDGEFSLDALRPGLEPECGATGPSELAALSIDRELMKARLPEHLRGLADRLAESSASEIAREDGVHRGTISRRVAQIRARSPEFDPAADDEGKNSGSARNTS